MSTYLYHCANTVISCIYINVYIYTYISLRQHCHFHIFCVYTHICIYHCANTVIFIYFVYKYIYVYMYITAPTLSCSDSITPLSLDLFVPLLFLNSCRCTFVFNLSTLSCLGFRCRVWFFFDYSFPVQWIVFFATGNDEVLFE